MCSHNGREPCPKGLVHVSKDVSRACNGSDTRHTITSTRKIQPSTLLGDAGKEPLLPSVPVMPTSLCQIIPYPLAPKPTTTDNAAPQKREVLSNLKRKAALHPGTLLR